MTAKATIPSDTMPPADLRIRVSGVDDVAHFDATGRRSIQDFSQALAGAGRAFGDFERILEWGCGCGRILRHLAPDGRQEVHGVDIDPEAIGWISNHLSWVIARQTGGLPPLPYPDGHFDLIINHSVLSHLDESYQHAWLQELERVLAPTGLLILTLQGPHAFDLWTSSLPRESLRARWLIIKAKLDLKMRGIHFLRNGDWSSYFPDYYQSTFHTPSYILKEWSRRLDIISYTPRGSLDHQDLVVLRHLRTRPEPPPRLHLSEALTLAVAALGRRLRKPRAVQS